MNKSAITILFASIFTIISTAEACGNTDLAEKSAVAEVIMSPIVNHYLNKAKEGDIEAHNNLGDIYFTGEHDVKQSYTRSAIWYKKAAKKGHVGSMNVLGYLYMVGKGVTKDYDKAVFWFQKVSDQGHYAGMGNLAEMYELNAVQGKNINDAFDLYQKALAAGNYFVRYHMGRHYQFGLGNTKKDATKALELYQKASDDGIMLADNAIANMYISEGKVSEAVELLLSLQLIQEEDLTDINGENAYDKVMATLNKLLTDKKIKKSSDRKRVKAYLQKYK